MATYSVYNGLMRIRKKPPQSVGRLILSLADYDGEHGFVSDEGIIPKHRKHKVVKMASAELKKKIREGTL